jgi:hypothetical protein
MNKVNNIKVDAITYREPGNGLPKWVKQAAVERGYGDSLEPVSLFINQDDINSACEAVAHGNGAACVMAQAGTRLGATSVYFYRTTAWIDFGDGPIVRFKVSSSIYNNVIDPFDKGDREAIVAGMYPLTPPVASSSLTRRRAYTKTHNKRKIVKKKKVVTAHTDRVVMAAQA